MRKNVRRGGKVHLSPLGLRRGTIFAEKRSQRRKGPLKPTRFKKRHSSLWKMFAEKEGSLKPIVIIYKAVEDHRTYLENRILKIYQRYQERHPRPISRDIGETKQRVKEEKRRGAEGALR